MTGSRPGAVTELLSWVSYGLAAESTEGTQPRSLSLSLYQLISQVVSLTLVTDISGNKRIHPLSECTLLGTLNLSFILVNNETPISKAYLKRKE